MHLSKLLLLIEAQRVGDYYKTPDALYQIQINEDFYICRLCDYDTEKYCIFFTVFLSKLLNRRFIYRLLKKNKTDFHRFYFIL